VKRTEEDIDRSSEGAGIERIAAAELLSCDCTPEQDLKLQSVARKGSRAEECDTWIGSLD